MKSLLAKLKKILKAIIQRTKQKGIKGLIQASVNYIRYGKAVVDEYAEWIEVNEPNEKQLNIQKKYESCQNIDFAIVLEEEQEQIIQSINNQTYSRWTIIKNGTSNILENNNSDYTIFIGKDIELASFALYDIVKTIEGHDGILYAVGASGQDAHRGDAPAAAGGRRAGRRAARGADAH